MPVGASQNPTNLRSKILAALGGGASNATGEILDWLFGGSLPYLDEMTEVGAGVLGKAAEKGGRLKEGMVRSMGPTGESLEALLGWGMGSGNPENPFVEALGSLSDFGPRHSPSLGIAPEDVKTGIVPLTPADIAQLGVLGTRVLKKPRTTYHGTGESFRHFDPAKARTGSGADLMGPGVYLTEGKPIGGFYFDQLSKKDLTPELTKAAEEVFRKTKGRYPAKIGRKPSSETINQATRDARNVRRIAYEIGQHQGAIPGAVRKQKLPRGSVVLGENEVIERPLFLELQKRLDKAGQNSNAIRLQKIHDATRQNTPTGFQWKISEIRDFLRQGMGNEAADALLHQNLREMGIDAISYPSGQVSGVDKGHRNYVVLNPDILNAPRKHLTRMNTRNLFSSPDKATSYLGTRTEGDLAEIGLGDVYDVVHGTRKRDLAMNPKGAVVGTTLDKPRSLHAGTTQAALDRLGNFGSGGTLIPVRMRFNRTLGTRANPLSDGRANALLSSDEAVGNLLDRGFDGIVYRNKVEDPGSISVAILGNKERMYPRKSMKMDDRWEKPSGSRKKKKKPSSRTPTTL